MRKGLSQTLWIVITIVVFLVIALVVLTIFGQSIGGFASTTEARVFCENQRGTTCLATGTLPGTWYTNNIRDLQTGELTSCSALTGETGCPTGG